MIICENSGQFKANIRQAPTGTQIEAVIPVHNGFLISHGQYVSYYQTSNLDDRAPLVLYGEKTKL